MADNTNAAAEVAAGAPPGMPQLDVATFGNQIFWLVVALLAIYFILSRIAIPRIAAILAERQGTITNAIASAEDLKAKAAKAEEAYHKALADARAEAQSIAAETRAAIQADLDDAIAKADAEISAKAAESEAAIADIRAGALDSVKDVAVDTAKELVAVLGGKADAKAVAEAYVHELSQPHNPDRWRDRVGDPGSGRKRPVPVAGQHRFRGAGVLHHLPRGPVLFQSAVDDQRYAGQARNRHLV